MARDEIATPTESAALLPIQTGDEELDRVVSEEEKVLRRVARTIKQKRGGRRTPLVDYDAELILLRDQIRAARMEDIPPLIEEMERLSGVAQRRAQVTEGRVDPMAPYFGRLVLEEDDRKREVLIGRSTYLDPKTGVRIVDWRDAPVSRIYYRYEEGDDFEETFGTREVEGEVLVRRALSIGQGRLKRVGSPQGTFIKKLDGTWRRAATSAVKLSGGQGVAMRPEKHHKPGKLGIRDDDLDRGEDKSLGEITALIDPTQFDLITKPTSGLVVIQGGAGSGKTTIGLHRLAYLAYQDRRRFRPDKMLVVVFNDALVRYIGRVLPALGVEGVRVTTYEEWAARLRDKHISHLPKIYAEDTPSVVTRMKKHPVMLELIEGHSDALALAIEDEILETGKKLEGGGNVLAAWRSSAGDAPMRRTHALRSWLKNEGKHLPLETRHSVERTLDRADDRLEDIIGAWADILTDKSRLLAAFAKAPDDLNATEVGWAHAWCSRRIPHATQWREERLEAIRDGEKPIGPRGTDGAYDDEPPTMDREDDAILLRLHQRLIGPLTRKRDRLVYEHMFVDETQDLSPLELSVVLDTASKAKSITLAGDVAQKLYMDNGFTDWRSVLRQLRLDHVEIEPLRLSYRSTFEILDFATDVLGPLRNQVVGKATRHGAPVELFGYTTTGEVVAMLAEALRELVRAEPLASVCVIARHPEQADVYYKGLVHGEVPNLRRIAEQDFPFRPGIDVTDVRQVKGLEFDYVVLVEVNRSTYAEDEEARHLLHIASTRAAHQLWVTATGAPSSLIPEALRARV